MNCNINQRPPPPKFNWNIYDNSSSDDTKPQITLQKSDKRRQKQVILLVDEMLAKLTHSNLLNGINIENIKQQSVDLLNNSVNEKVKSKKYQSIACALIIQSLRILLIPLRIKEITQTLNCDEKQVRKILIQLNQIKPFDQDAFTLQYMTRICVAIGFNQKFQTLCRFYYSSLKNQNLVQGEHEHVIASALVKLTGDFIFQEKGGINLNVISENAGCCEISLKNLLQKVQPYNQVLVKQAYEFYRRTM
ncbi:unnamed protein product (macronuclear) [Paramecium tetraurelia]|uniref:Cyclin N-terminal domain-containing protein n=1 Tax=Paramecium tetraurelia TaxID=5888 RepID=A0C7D4_PARTE|nr:uncharacterized protein GSPATT00035831001 [Paramecium tetraurelia]CAK66701.1 unnamed protein product [Paramecium tetraurelia]|eukprot:XP_001434098.1 hypothetical protein (macronuclear) [Paramecium tetraurelia strain d4-2]